MSSRTLRAVLAALGVAVASTAFPDAGAAQEDCETTSEGRICRHRQEIRNGLLVQVDQQRRLGLITVAGGCSGTLLNRHWILTARHCVTDDPANSTLPVDIASPLFDPRTIWITAAWAPNRFAWATEYRDFGINAPPNTPTQDIILIYLGTSDLGAVDWQPLYASSEGIFGRENADWTAVRLVPEDTCGPVRDRASRPSPPRPPTAQGLGVYRSGELPGPRPSARSYTLAMNDGRVGHGGDSGGPTWVIRNGVGVGHRGRAVGVLAHRLRDGAACEWAWALGITGCTYVSVERYVDEIAAALLGRPDCRPELAGCVPSTTPVLAAHLLD
jgi:hypothetical protein